MSYSCYRRLDEWYPIVMTCRQSGLTDSEWCRQNGISHSTFCKAVRRLRQAACDIPRGGLTPTYDVTKTSQDVVQISITPDEAIDEASSVAIKDENIENNIHTIEISTGGCTIRVSNSVEPSLLAQILYALGGTR